MRIFLALPVVLLAVACSKEPEPSKSANSPPPPTPKAEVSRNAPAGGTPAAADSTPAGPKASGEGYTAEVAVPADCDVGKPCVAHVTAHPTTGYHMNKDFPTSIDVTAPAGVTVAKPKQEQGDAVKLDTTEAAFDVSFTPADAGAKAFSAVFRFAVCTDTTCNPKKEKLAWNVNAK